MSDSTHPSGPGAPRPGLRFIADGLAARAGRLEAALKRLTARETDEEAVHDVRVATRRLLGGIDACPERMGRRKRVRRLRRGLKSLRRSLGAAREAEVGLATLREIQGGLSETERLAAGVLATTLSLTRSRLQAGMAEVVAENRPGQILAGARRLVARLLEASTVTPEAGEEMWGLADLKREALSAMASRREKLLELPREPLDALEDEALHGFRIGVKKLRYTMEFYGGLFSARLDSRLRMLRELQDVLGHLHDLQDMKSLVLSFQAEALKLELSPPADVLQSLAGRIESHRRRSAEGLGALLDALSHPGFLPSLRPAGGPPAQEPRLRIVDPPEKEELG